MIKSHEDNNDNDNFKHVCIIVVFLLIKLFYLLIHSLDYLFRSIQTLVIFMNLIDLIVMPSSIACCLLNLSPKLTFSQHACVLLYCKHYVRNFTLIYYAKFFICFLVYSDLTFKIYYHLNKLIVFTVDNIISIFLCHSLKQLLNNIIFIMLIISSAFKCFINFSKYMITAV